jgi:hypothetical protein
VQLRQEVLEINNKNQELEEETDDVFHNIWESEDGKGNWILVFI